MYQHAWLHLDESCEAEVGGARWVRDYSDVRVVFLKYYRAPDPEEREKFRGRDPALYGGVAAGRGGAEEVER